MKANLYTLVDQISDGMEARMRRLEAQLFPTNNSNQEDKFLMHESDPGQPDHGMKLLHQALSGDISSSPEPLSLSNTQIVHMVVVHGLTPGEFVLLLSQRDLAHLHYLEKLAKEEDLSVWPPSFLSLVQDLISSHNFALKVLPPSENDRAAPASGTSGVPSKAAENVELMEDYAPSSPTSDQVSPCAEADANRTSHQDSIIQSPGPLRDDFPSSPIAGSSRASSSTASREQSSRLNAGSSTAPTSASPDDQASSLPVAGPSNGPPQASSSHSANPAAGPAADPYREPGFPPGRNDPGFIPLGVLGVASPEQGNFWPIGLDLRDAITVAEVDGRGLRGFGLTYEQVLQKYHTWQGGVTASTLRGRNRHATVAPEHRARDVVFDAEDMQALRDAVPLCTNAAGKVSWKGVREAIIDETGRPFGVGTLAKKWRTLAQE